MRIIASPCNHKFVHDIDLINLFLFSYLIFHYLHAVYKEETLGYCLEKIFGNGRANSGNRPRIFRQRDG